MLGYCWLFTLFLSRLGRCFTQVERQVDSAPTYRAAIFESLLAIFDAYIHHKEVLTTLYIIGLIEC